MVSAFLAMLSSSSDNSASREKKRTIYTITLNQKELAKLNDHCQVSSYEPYFVEHALFAYKGNQVNIVAYKSGKVVIQGKRTEDFVTYTLEGEITLTPRLGYDSIHNPSWFEAHAGMDESGKGDFFGPLVTACVIAEEGVAQKLIDAGVKDSKSITSDAAILKLEGMIRKMPGLVVKTTFAGMEKYNELYGKFGNNLNRLLAWMHATALKDALKQKPVSWGLLDQFSEAPLVQNYLKDLPFELRMQTKAESDPIVAAASIIARATYVKELEKLSEQAGEKLLKGAGTNVLKQGQSLVKKLGEDALKRFAKCHFRTAYTILGLPEPEKKVWTKRT